MPHSDSVSFGLRKFDPPAIVGAASTKILIAIAVLLFVSGVSFGQDLGSTGGLVGKKKDTTTSSPSKSKSATGKKAVSKRSSKRTTKKSTPKAPTEGEVAQEVIQEMPRLACATKEKISDTVRLTSFERAYLDGVAARQARDYRRGEASLLDAITYKCDMRVYQELGGLYADEQRWTQAEIAYRGALALEPNNWKLMVLLSDVLTRPIFIPRLSDRYAEAEKLARRAVFMAPMSMEANLQLGEALEMAGNISRETLASYQSAVRINPKSAEAYAHLGRLYKKNGRAREATESLQKATTLATDGASKIVVAEILQTFGLYSDSEQLLRDALSKDQTNPLALQLLGKALVRQQKYSEAEAVLKKGADFNLESIVPYISLGNFYIQQARFTEAEAALNRAVDLVLPSERPIIAQQFRVLAEAYGRAGRVEDADRIEKQAKTIESAKKA